MQVVGELGGLDVLVNNASDLGPVPLAMLSDTECEDLERAFATNVLGPFRLTKALMGALAASAREGRGAVVLNISSDAAVNAYPAWGAYGASKAALHHLSRVWGEEHAADGVRFLSLDPGDMDTPMHAAAIPDADPSTLKRPEQAARELADAIADALPSRAARSGRRTGRSDRMIAATRPTQRPPDAKLLVVDAGRRIGHVPRSAFVEFLRAGDLVVANDAATLPASLRGVHGRTGAPVEVRLAGRPSLEAGGREPLQRRRLRRGRLPHAHRRPRGPAARSRTATASSSAPCARPSSGLLGHPRLVSLCFDGSPDEVWAGLARHGRPIQYAHVHEPLALWDVWTRFAGPPVAFEPPSAGFALDWRALAAMRARGVEFETITHAAGISSTGDEELDRLLPFDEPYRIPGGDGRRRQHARRLAAAASSRSARRSCARSNTRRRRAARCARAKAWRRSASGRRAACAWWTRSSRARTSAARATTSCCAPSSTTRRSCARPAELDARGYLTHEFGDSVLIERVSG